MPKPPRESTDAQTEGKLFWDVHDRMDAIEKRIEEWRDDRTTSLSERDAKLSELKDRSDELSELVSRGNPSKLARLKRWYFGSTKKQRKPWLEGRGPNVPLLDNIQRYRRDVVWPLIEKAVAATDGSTSAVYVLLKEFALNQTAPLTNVDKDGAILYASTKNKQKRLTRDALDKRLIRASRRQ